jgi:TolA-binding protein
VRASDCASELVVLTRRRALSSTETLALRTHLVECPSCRLAQQVAEDFEQQTAPAADDSAVVLRMSEAARRWTRERDRPRAASEVVVRRPVRRPVRIMAMAASMVLIAGTVSALLLWRRPQVADPLPNSSTIAPVRQAPLLPRAAPTAVTAVPPPAAAEPPPPSQPSGARDASPPLSATLLLQRANDARRRGDISQAITLYRRLQQMFPTSSEAVLSAAPLGGLLLERGGARPALEQFDRYLREAPAGVLVPEALYGRGRALRALGDAGEERRTWRRLIEAFPDSPYAPLARRRLADLK